MLITASRIHNGYQWLPPGTVIEVADDGSIIALHSEDAPLADVVHYDGILSPGFVNAHCHLELSHMKDLVGEGTGLMHFLQQVIWKRESFTIEQKITARHEAYDELLENGVVAVGDIANSADTLDIRALDRLHIHTFVECLGFTEERAQQMLDFSEKVYLQYTAQQSGDKILRQSIVPHAPYSVSPSLFRLIDAYDKDALISIHNEETIEELNFYKDKSGAVNDLLHSLNIDAAFFEPSGKSPLQTYLPYFSPSHPFIFVHNTFATAEDLQFAQDNFPAVYWCLCPNANKYIEGRLPDMDMLLQHAKNICIGTDSLTSNHQLCILSELYTIRAQYSGLEWGLLLRWATSSGAAALQMQDKIGSIEPGKQPGIVQITGLDDNNIRPTPKRIM
ncbi:MAG: hypothetical protein BGO69_00325 [Bacteroidetes bacterium 46-16]|nr:MAG: hypothetical protein BGO69_00325 [Bacteroidetes bacterium 46-16]